MEILGEEIKKQYKVDSLGFINIQLEFIKINEDYI